MEMPELPEMNWRYIGIGIAALVVVVLALVYAPAMISAKAINAYFSTSKLAPGQSTNLLVDITNTLGKDVDSYSISVTAVNSGITVGDFSKPAGTIGSGEIRKITVPVSLDNGLLDGTYSIEINVVLDSTPYSARVLLEVKK